MTNRVIVYPGALPLDTDLLNTNKNLMIALGYVAQAAFGTGTQVDGLSISATTTPSLTVNVGPGSIYYYTIVDQNAYGSLGADSTDPLMKVGVNIGSTSFTLAAPTVSGQSINYLIEASFLEQDTNPTVLSFFNAANPSSPYSGAANSGVASNTLRAQTVSLQLKSGTAATTNTQTTPSVDSGWVGLYVITVNYGQTQITNTQLASCTYPGAPFINPKLSQGGRVRLSSNLTLYVSATGSDSTGNGTSAFPFATIQHAYSTMMTGYDFNGHYGTISVSDGTYTSSTSFAGMPVGYASGSPLYVVGDTGTPSNCAIQVNNANCFNIGQGAYVSITGFSLSASGSVSDYVQQGVGFNVTYQGNLIFYGVVFSTCYVAHILNNGGNISLNSTGKSYTISGNAPSHLVGGGAGVTNLADATITLSGTPAFSGGYITLNTAAYAGVWGCTFSGSATGTRYAVATNAMLNTEGAGGSYLPGNASGSTSSGGLYF